MELHFGAILYGEAVSVQKRSKMASYTLSIVTGNGHVKYMANPFLPLPEHLPSFVTVETSCKSDLMTGYVKYMPSISFAIIISMCHFYMAFLHDIVTKHDKSSYKS